MTISFNNQSACRVQFASFAKIGWQLQVIIVWGAKCKVQRPRNIGGISAINTSFDIHFSLVLFRL